MDILKTVRAYNERLRRAIKNYGQDSKIVKDMITRAKFAVDLTFKANGFISTAKADIPQNPTHKTNLDVGKFVGENRVKKLIDSVIVPEKMKEIRKEKDRVKRNALISEAYTKTKLTGDLIAAIWKDMYGAGYTVDECNETYDELKANNDKYGSYLTQYFNGEISINDLVESINRDRYAGRTLTPEELDELTELEDF